MFMGERIMSRGLVLNVERIMVLYWGSLAIRLCGTLCMRFGTPGVGIRVLVVRAILRWLVVVRGLSSHCHKFGREDVGVEEMTTMCPALYSTRYVDDCWGETACA